MPLYFKVNMSCLKPLLFLSIDRNSVIQISRAELDFIHQALIEVAVIHQNRTRWLEDRKVRDLIVHFDSMLKEKHYRYIEGEINKYRTK